MPNLRIKQCLRTKLVWIKFHQLIFLKFNTKLSQKKNFLKYFLKDKTLNICFTSLCTKLKTNSQTTINSIKKCKNWTPFKLLKLPRNLNFKNAISSILLIAKKFFLYDFPVEKNYNTQLQFFYLLGAPDAPL